MQHFLNKGLVDSITGNTLIDVVLSAVITGGAAVTLLSLLLDRLSKKREEYLELIKEKIKKFREKEAFIMLLASNYYRLNEVLGEHLLGESQQLNYRLCIFYICNIFNLIGKLSSGGGLVQLDNVWVENIISELIGIVHRTVQDNDLVYKLSLADIHRLRTLIDEKYDFNEFQLSIISNVENATAYVKTLQCIHELQEKKGLNELQQKSFWISWLIYIEVNLMYEIYYGKHQIRRYYEVFSPLPRELLVYLYNSHPDYYNRLYKHGVVQEDIPL